MLRALLIINYYLKTMYYITLFIDDETIMIYCGYYE